MKSVLLSAAAISSLCLVMNSNAVEIIGHRGASHDAPENTVASAKLCWEQKADALELDIYLTKDGKIVVIHDKTTKRTTGTDGNVAEMTLEELRKLDAGSWKNPKYAGEKLPTLDEMLSTMPKGKKTYIEIKCGTEVLPELKRVIDASKRPAQELVIIAFSYKVATEAKKLFPKIEVAYLYDWKKDKDTAAKFDADALIEHAKKSGLDALDLEFKGPIDTEFVTKARKAGLKVYVWTVDDAVAAARLKETGIDGITTNRPQWLREQLSK